MHNAEQPGQRLQWERDPHMGESKTVNGLEDTWFEWASTR